MKILKKTKTTWRIASEIPDETRTGHVYAVAVEAPVTGQTEYQSYQTVNMTLAVAKIKPAQYEVFDYKTGEALGEFARAVQPMGVALETWFSRYWSDKAQHLKSVLAECPKLNGT